MKVCGSMTGSVAEPACRKPGLPTVRPEVRNRRVAPNSLAADASRGRTCSSWVRPAHVVAPKETTNRIRAVQTGNARVGTTALTRQEKTARMTRATEAASGVQMPSRARAAPTTTTHVVRRRR